MRKPVLPTVTTNPEEAPTGVLRSASEKFVVGAVLGPDSNGSFDHLLATFSNLRKRGRLAIILYHGINEAALKALPRVIKAALDKGREAVTISELIRQ